jgi:protease-4
VDAVAQGRVWTGEQALERKLVDELGGLDVAIRRARERAGIPEGEAVAIERYPRRKTFFDQLAEDLREGRAPAEVRLLPGLERALAQFEGLQRVLEGAGVAAMLPGLIEIR